jgi:purine-binding chemotaxis protein CheW
MADAAELRLIAFRAGEETFLVDIMAVRQIINYKGATTVPNAPRFIEGIVVLRNEVIPIVDLRERFGVSSLQSGAEHPMVLVTDTGDGAIGLKVDEVRSIVNVASDALLPAPEIIRGIRGDLLVAIVPQGEDVYLLIDIDSVLTSEERTALHSAKLSSEAGVSDR